MRQNRFLGGDLELNPESKVNEVVEQNPSLKKTDINLKCRKKYFLVIIFLVSIFSVKAQHGENSSINADFVLKKSSIIVIDPFGVKGKNWYHARTEKFLKESGFCCVYRKTDENVTTADFVIYVYPAGPIGIGFHVFDRTLGKEVFKETYISSSNIYTNPFVNFILDIAPFIEGTESNSPNPDEFKTFCGIDILLKDLLGRYDHTSAKRACPQGWRLPTSEELKCLCNNKEDIGGFNGIQYWTSETHPKKVKRAISRTMDDCKEYVEDMTDKCSVRCVRTHK